MNAAVRGESAAGGRREITFVAFEWSFTGMRPLVNDKVFFSNGGVVTVAALVGLGVCSLDNARRFRTEYECFGGPDDAFACVVETNAQSQSHNRNRPRHI